MSSGQFLDLGLDKNRSGRGVGRRVGRWVGARSMMSGEVPSFTSLVDVPLRRGSGGGTEAAPESKAKRSALICVGAITLRVARRPGSEYLSAI